MTLGQLSVDCLNSEDRAGLWGVQPCFPDCPETSCRAHLGHWLLLPIVLRSSSVLGAVTYSLLTITWKLKLLLEAAGERELLTPSPGECPPGKGMISFFLLFCRMFSLLSMCYLFFRLHQPEIKPRFTWKS